jgi:hypothetical protein
MVDEMQVLARMRSELPSDVLDTEHAERLFQTKLSDEQNGAGIARSRWRGVGAHPARRRYGVWALGGAAVLALALAVVSGLGGIGAPAASKAGRSPAGVRFSRALSAAGVLHAAAREAASISPIPEPAAHRWIYTSVVQVNDGHRSISDNWIRFDGIQSAYMQDGKLITHTVTYMRDGQPVVDNALAKPVPPGTNPLVVYNGMPMSSYVALASLKQPPAAVLNDVRRVVSRSHGTPSRPAAMSHALAVREFKFLAQLLWNASLVPTGAESDVFNALATLPGISVQQGQTDAVGQPAIAVGTTGANGKQLLFNPTSFRVLGIRSTTPPPQLCTPTTCGAGATTTTAGGTGTSPTLTAETRLNSTSLAYAKVALVPAPGDR